MAAINIILSVVVAFVPVLSVFLMLILPLTSTIVTIFCKEKFYPIYAIATIGLSIVATIYNVETTIFYVIPSVLTGFCFGMMIKYRISTIWVIISASLIQTICTMVTIPLINLIFDTDIIQFFEKVFGVNEYNYIYAIIPSIIFFISLAQILLSYIIISSEITKFNYAFQSKQFSSFWCSIYLFASLLLTLATAFFFVDYAFLFLSISAYFLVFLIASLIQRKYYVALILTGVSVLVALLLFGVFYGMVQKPYGLLFIGIFPLLVSIETFINSLLKKEIYKDRINRTKAE